MGFGAVWRHTSCVFLQHHAEVNHYVDHENLNAMDQLGVIRVEVVTQMVVVDEVIKVNERLGTENQTLFQQGVVIDRIKCGAEVE